MPPTEGARTNQVSPNAREVCPNFRGELENLRSGVEVTLAMAGLLATLKKHDINRGHPSFASLDFHSSMVERRAGGSFADHGETEYDFNATAFDRCASRRSRWR